MQIGAALQVGGDEGNTPTRTNWPVYSRRGHNYYAPTKRWLFRSVSLGTPIITIAAIASTLKKIEIVPKHPHWVAGIGVHIWTAPLIGRTFINDITNTTRFSYCQANSGWSPFEYLSTSPAPLITPILGGASTNNRQQRYWQVNNGRRHYTSISFPFHDLATFVLIRIVVQPPQMKHSARSWQISGGGKLFNGDDLSIPDEPPAAVADRPSETASN